jgi:hypothetical protein
MSSTAFDMKNGFLHAGQAVLDEVTPRHWLFRLKRTSALPSDD